MSDHTAEPWKKIETPTHIEIWGSNQDGDTNVWICSIPKPPNCNSTTATRVKSDACVIANAAHLLWVVKMLRVWHDDDPWKDNDDEDARLVWESRRDIMDKAIAKAEGLPFIKGAP